MRDGFYGIHNGLTLLPNVTNAMLSAEFMFRHQRTDSGVMPVMVQPDGTPRYGRSITKKERKKDKRKDKKKSKKNTRRSEK